MFQVVPQHLLQTHEACHFVLNQHISKKVYNSQLRLTKTSQISKTADHSRMEAVCHKAPVNSTSSLSNWLLRKGSQHYGELTSWSYSKKIWKFLSLLKTGWEDSLCRKTSCTWTVFLNTARYSLERKQHMKKMQHVIGCVARAALLFVLHFWVDTHASSSCFILVYSSFVMVASPSPSLCIFSLGLSKSGFGGAGGI